MNYKGRITTVGDSDAIRIDKALFKQHPEFKKKAVVNAHIIGPGKMLISVENSTIADEYDPILDAFLSFLEGDMSLNPGSIGPLDAVTIERAKAVTEGVTYTDADFD